MTNNPQALYLVHALTPLRVGADQGIGAIDLPTLREAHTGWPILPGSSVKGVLREQAEVHFGRDAPEVRSIFGPPTELAGDYRGGMVFGDAYPLLLPVRSLAGTFAWVTCAQVLRRLERDAAEAKVSLECPAAAPESGVRLPSNPRVDTTTDSELVVDRSTPGPQHVLLEDLCFDVTPDRKLATLGNTIARWTWPAKEMALDFLLRRLALVPDDVFSYLCRHRLEVRARVAIKDSTGTVSHGPWTEELIPAETVLCGILQGRGTTVRTRKPGNQDAGRNVNDEDLEAKVNETDEKKGPDAVLADLRKVLKEPRVLRLGGHGSVGLGRARVTLVADTRGKDPRR